MPVSVAADRPTTGRLVNGPLGRATLELAAPTIASLLLQAAYSIVNIFWVGQLGATALAASNAAAFLVWTLDAVAAICSVGTNTLVARHVGAGEPAQARRLGGDALLLSGVVTTCITVLGLVFNEPVFASMGTAEDVTALGVSYLAIIYWGAFGAFYWVAIEAIFRAHGDTRTPMLLVGSALVINAAIDPLLIYGVGPLDGMGVAGAALATVICRAACVAIGLVLLARRSLIARPGAASLTRIVEIARIGLPIAVSNVGFCLVYMALTRVISRFGTPAVAAVGIGHKSEAVTFFVSYGLAFAAATVVSQNLGADRRDRAVKAAWIACGLGLVVAAAFFVLLVSVPTHIAGVFIDDPKVVDEAATYMRIVAVSELFLVFEVVLEGAFSGAGDTVPPLVVAGPLSVARIPLAWLLAVWLDWGAAGIWWAISLSTMAKGALLAVWFGRKYGWPTGDGAGPVGGTRKR